MAEQSVCSPHERPSHEIHYAPGVEELLPGDVRSHLSELLRGVAIEVESLDERSCLAQAVFQSAMRLDVLGWQVLFRVRGNETRVLAASPR